MANTINIIRTREKRINCRIINCGLSIFDNEDDGHPYWRKIFFIKIAENEQWRTYEARIVYIVTKKKQFVEISPEILHDKFNTTQLPAYKRGDG